MVAAISRGKSPAPTIVKAETERKVAAKWFRKTLESQTSAESRSPGPMTPKIVHTPCSVDALEEANSEENRKGGSTIPIMV